MIILTQDKTRLVDAQFVGVKSRGDSHTLWAGGLYFGSDTNMHEMPLTGYDTYEEAQEAIAYIAERLNAGDTVVEL